ncbi:PAQR-type receptor [Kluyveromyces lactis]|uniref:KLLA0D01331p n=1 Tax=Kluyveromyces lactis (strain ATCC 8585 / CBS 2359 / DSM 70799 / NBRC 1267 / NRRL Y-1140 / WM37) TaxID=284590 RepID=Q6CSG1_KLULA|nr:uncharacterized protein KLLA0_D01331g [Kluyveromyces lactis]CAH00224.1 KLLA0D01331p [Kluyveromyces lactis]|eukprot:XP_453128.1 uncharacterized protein KLLA0_D01331g [Kluyveromyces lactis]
MSTRKRSVVTEETALIEETPGTKKTVRVYERRVYSWDEIPDWQKDNEHILHGYVRETQSWKELFHSLFYLHNESVNIYTHLIPAVALFFIMLFATHHVINEYPTTSAIDYFMINLFFFGCATCLTMSSMFHTIKCHSLPIATFGNKLDYLGIVVLISTSMISILFYGFHDSSLLFYPFAGLTSLFGLICGYMSLKDKFRSREWRPYRATMFVLFGLSAVFPIVAGFIVYGKDETWKRVQLTWVIWEGVLYIFGAFLYGVRFPERLAPGKFDIWGHSHQLFHVLVVVAALCHLKALVVSYGLVHQALSQ